jgi:hypothetical protein
LERNAMKANKDAKRVKSEKADAAGVPGAVTDEQLTMVSGARMKIPGIHAWAVEVGTSGMYIMGSPGLNNV